VDKILKILTIKGTLEKIKAIKARMNLLIN
jgi:hypothetical protein